MFVPIFLSGSRGGFLFLVITLAFQLWRFQRRGILVMGGLTLLALFNSSFLARGYIENMLNIPADLMSQSDTIGLRISLWQFAVELWKTSPLWGIGTGMFMVRSIASPVLAGRKMLQAHNAYVTHLAENGIIGLMLFLMILVKSALNYEQAIRFFRDRQPQLAKLAITWQSVLLLYALNSLKGNLNTGKIFWLSFGISLVFQHMVSALKQITPEDNEVYARPQLRTTFAEPD